MIYTIAIGEGFHRMAELWLEAVLKNTNGKILILTDADHPIGKELHGRVTQRRVRVDSRAESMRLKYRARHFIRTEMWEPVTFLDCDIVLRGTIDDLIDDNDAVAFESVYGYPITSEFHAAYLSEVEMAGLSRPGLNAGAFSVKGVHFHALMERWETIDAGTRRRDNKAVDQPAWNRLILDLEREAQLKTRCLPWPAVMFHPTGGSAEEKLARMREAVS